MTYTGKATMTAEEFRKMANTGTVLTADRVKIKMRGRTRQFKRHVSGEMNATEQRFYDEWIKPRIIAGELIEFWFEEWTFKLAKDCRYTPDFVIQDKDGYLQAFEVKGTTKNAAKQEIPFSQDDSMVKVRVSPHRFPLEFFIAHPRAKNLGGGWHILPK
jgi:hypothetical protein